MQTVKIGAATFRFYNDGQIDAAKQARTLAELDRIAAGKKPKAVKRKPAVIGGALGVGKFEDLQRRAYDKAMETGDWAGVQRELVEASVLRLPDRVKPDTTRNGRWAA